MKCKEIIEKIEARYPKAAALSFDNVGLQVGRNDREVKKIYLALDATDGVIAHAIEWKADMLITHHPMIFDPLKSVTEEDFIGRRIIKLIQNDIPYYAMHTNYDVLGMAELSGNILELQNTVVLEESYWSREVPIAERKAEGIGRVGDLKEPMTIQECCDFVKEKLKLDNIKVFADFEDDDRKYKRMAVSPGSGKSMTEIALEKQADVLVTGDIDHHAGIDAVAKGMAIIDAGHYGTEYIFMDDIKQFINDEIPELEVEMEKVAQPFHIM